MDNIAFDRSLVASAFELIARSGWSHLSVAAAARAADLAIDRARRRFPCKLVVLLRFATLADAQALTGILEQSSPRDKLLGIVMSRIDALQAHRAGVIALLRELPKHPATSLALLPPSLCSMRWMLDGAGIDTSGIRGKLRIHGMHAVWLYTVRAWQGDESEDLSATMAALDRALDRAEQAEGTFGGRGSAAAEPGMTPSPGEEAPVADPEVTA